MKILHYMITNLKTEHMTKEKKHADFQSPYRKSMNFDKVTKNENLEPDGKGNIKLENESTGLSASEKKKIANAMDNMHHNIEMIPGAAREEEE
ncbi:hypothetical protein N7U66_07590 [Lacinutrix neustonica]|uniref:Uncharacterized protein n=1 Tax=Lacinutrix neustonica TaxID=2980107 RepID=A0A9E8MXW4_9FLAO|nr:hypothetical protein [Lacinutrix neustonica]WAC03386.1 hypothetical protein N7U66_07590 [Lacinutrix neustonica]